MFNIVYYLIWVKPFNSDNLQYSKSLQIPALNSGFYPFVSYKTLMFLPLSKSFGSTRCYYWVQQAAWNCLFK